MKNVQKKRKTKPFWTFFHDSVNLRPKTTSLLTILVTYAPDRLYLSKNISKSQNLGHFLMENIFYVQTPIMVAEAGNFLFRCPAQLLHYNLRRLQCGDSLIQEKEHSVLPRVRHPNALFLVFIFFLFFSVKAVCTYFTWLDSNGF